jgi:DNA-binding MurR/RpiR family transcriptional regulator
LGTARGSVGNGVHKPALSVLINVRRALPSLRPAEQRVAHAVLADPAGISESSITAVARMCDTSETTVLRFCRAIGLAGYPELRIALARAAQFEETDHAGGPPLNGTISATDGLADVVAKIAHADARAIEDTAATLDLNALKGAIDALLNAARVDIYGVGASGLVGHLLHQKLHRVGLVSYVATETQLALTSAELLGPGDVALGITHTGVTPAVVDALQVARQRGATTIAVTNYDRSAVAAQSNLILTTAARETTFRAGSMASRITQLAVVDCLFAGVAQRAYDASIAALPS